MIPPRGVKKTRVSGIDEALALTRERHPSAHMEGAAGLRRGYYIHTNGERLLVGDCWSSGRRGKDGELVWWFTHVDPPRAY